MLTITIMQGLPGSGKSYHAVNIAGETWGEVVSADTFPGLYTPQADGPPMFNVALLGNAHGACFRRAIEMLQAGRSVVVDNTNTTQLEVAPYVQLAQAFGAAPKLVRITCDPDKAFARNTHGVPRQGFDGMVKRLEAFEPAFHWQFIPGFETRTIAN